MLQVNEIFKNAVEQDSRTFKARVVLGKDIFEGIKSFALHAASNNSAHISIGGAVAASVQVKMEATTISLESKEITLQIGVLSGTEYIYCDLGKFTPEKVNNDDGIINFCAYDRMYVKFSKAYVSKLEYPADGKEVLKEISNMSGVPLASSIDNLPSGVKIPKRWKETETTYDDEGNEITQGNYVNPFDGYTMQDALGYVAQFYGKYCVINRNGEIELRWYEQADYEISTSRYYDDLKKSESLFKLGRIQCDTATVTLLFMAIDYISGLIVAGVFHNSKKTESGTLESRTGWKGLCRKCMTLLFVLVAYRLDLAIGVDYIRNAVIIGFMANELISIVENAGLMGIPLPAVIANAIDILTQKAEKKGDA